LSCTVLCAVGAAATLLPDGWGGGPWSNLRGGGRTLKDSKQRRLQLAAADYSAMLAGAAPAAPASPAMGAPAMGTVPSVPVAGSSPAVGGAELSDADIARFLAKYDLELKDLELLKQLREGYVKADGSGSSAPASSTVAASPADGTDYSAIMAAGGAPPVPEPPTTPAAPAMDYAAILGTPAATSSTPEAAAPPAATSTPTTTTSTSTPLAVPLGPVEDCSAEADNWLQNFCELRNYKNTHGDCNVPDKWEDNRILSNWVKKQREQYDLLMAGQDNQMNSDRKDKLDEIGFDYTGTGGGSGGSAGGATATVMAAPPPAETATTQGMSEAPPAMSGMPPAAPAAPAMPTDPTQMTFEQQMAAMQAMSF